MQWLIQVLIRKREGFEYKVMLFSNWILSKYIRTLEKFAFGKSEGRAPRVPLSVYKKGIL